MLAFFASQVALLEWNAAQLLGGRRRFSIHRSGCDPPRNRARFSYQDRFIEKHLDKAAKTRARLIFSSARLVFGPVRFSIFVVGEGGRLRSGSREPHVHTFRLRPLWSSTASFVGRSIAPDPAGPKRAVNAAKPPRRNVSFPPPSQSSHPRPRPAPTPADFHAAFYFRYSAILFWPADG